MTMTDPRWHSPAAERNRHAIAEVLQRWLPAGGVALEIACGTGQHACHFAAALPGWTWLATDPDSGAVASATAWLAEAVLPNTLPPRPFDVLAADWPSALPELAARPPDMIFNANMIHIAPWATCAALMQGAAAHLAAGGLLVMYGPYLLESLPQNRGDAPGNLAFDADLRARNPAWGVRRLAAVLAEAGAAGLQLTARAEMPANNLMLAFRRAA
jgi:SAM-dependent methyltransferase